MSSSSNNIRQQLRREMRRRRRALSPAQQRHAAQALVRHFSQHPWFKRSRHLALYLSNDGEIDTRPLIELAWQQGKQVYLPVLHPLSHNRLWFLPYQQDTRLRLNQYRIPEPPLQPHRRRLPWTLDLVCMPLVAFDPQGGRLGMGGGYYDRTFAFLNRQPNWGKPRLLGLAHECQKVEHLPLASWDIPLSAILTDSRLYQAMPTDGSKG